MNSAFPLRLLGKGKSLKKRTFSDDGGANQLSGRAVIIRWDGTEDFIWISIGYNPFSYPVFHLLDLLEYLIYSEIARLCGYI